MASIELTTHIAAPPEIVFAIATDFARAADVVDGIARVEMLTDGPVGVGTKFRETRVMLGGESTEEMTVAAFDPPRSYTLEAVSCGCLFASTLAFAPQGGGTDMTMTIRTKPLTLMAKLMSPLGALMAGTMKKAIDQDMECLKRAAEARASEE